MTVCLDVICDGFEFDLLLGAYDHGGSIVLSDQSPLGNPAYIAALQKMQALLPYYQIREYLNSEFHEYYYKGDWADDSRLKLIIQAYEQNIIPVTEEQYKLVVSWMNGKAYLKTYRPKHVIPGYAYLMADSTGLYKIGHSKDPSTRVKQVTSRANPVTLICQIASDNAVYLEYELHERFHDERVSGEWFALCPDSVDYIKSLSGVGV